MAELHPDPYTVLGVERDAPEAEVRTAYRRLVKRHHPDHNHGSPASARRFEAVQEAYAAVRRSRASGAHRPPPPSGAPAPDGPAGSQAPTESQPDPDFAARLADLEREVRRAHQARQRVKQAARKIHAEAQRTTRRTAADAADAASTRRRSTEETATRRRPTDEELGYFSIDDSVARILADARAELLQRYGEAREHPVVRRVTDLMEGLEDLAGKLDRPPRKAR